MKNRGMGIKHPKIRGEWVELRFMMRALELGLHLNKPWGEVMPYDFVVVREARVRAAGAGEARLMFSLIGRGIRARCGEWRGHEEGIRSVNIYGAGASVIFVWASSGRNW